MPHPQPEGCTLASMTRRSFPPPVTRTDQPLSQDETIKWLLYDRSGRRNHTVPIRRAFAQGLDEDGPRTAHKPGPLHQLIRNELALDLLLLVHAVASGGDFSVTERAETWARATGVSFKTDGSASAPVSRLWHRLDELQLIGRSTDGRLTKVTKLREDGSGNPYTRPAGSKTGPLRDIYFQVPFTYWDDGLHRKLDMAGKTVMLIGMSLRKVTFALPQTKTFAGYYGISETTLRRGISKLLTAKILNEVDSETYLTGETATGTGVRILFSFRPPYDLNLRKSDAKTEAAASPAVDEDEAAASIGLPH